LTRINPAVHEFRLFRPLDGSSEQEVPISGDARPYILETGAISKDGKLQAAVVGEIRQMPQKLQ
jgi:hypothetical protein